MDQFRLSAGRCLVYYYPEYLLDKRAGYQHIYSTSTIEIWVFKCATETNCNTGYVLDDYGTQTGAQDGTDSEGARSGGCGWNGVITALFMATFGALRGSWDLRNHRISTKMV